LSTTSSQCVSSFVYILYIATTIASILSETDGDEKLSITNAIASSFGQSMETTFSVRKWLSKKEQASMNGANPNRRSSQAEAEDQAEAER
jgi:hypothetical protein